MATLLHRDRAQVLEREADHPVRRAREPALGVERKLGRYAITLKR